MKVANWGTGLAVRLPAELVRELNLKVGDEIALRVRDPRSFDVERDGARERAVRRLRELRRPLPVGFRFDRDEVNDR
jgi:antitoxin MazE